MNDRLGLFTDGGCDVGMSVSESGHTDPSGEVEEVSVILVENRSDRSVQANNGSGRGDPISSNELTVVITLKPLPLLNT